MNYKQMFDGTFVDENYNPAYKVSTLTNPAGFVVRDQRTGKSLTISVDEVLDFADVALSGSSKSHLRMEDLAVKAGR